VAVGPLEGLQQAQRLLHRAAHGIVINLDTADDSGRVCIARERSYDY
jgi:hypothetical protein